MRLVISKKILLSIASGTMLEYYDFALFALFLPIISPIFFPSSSSYNALENGYIVLCLTLLARPLGGLAFGYIGDTSSRRKALLFSIYGIAIATLVIGLAPSYAQIGIWSAVILILAKVVQTFCYGGEYNGAAIYVIEHAEKGQESYASSVLTALSVSGSLIAALIGCILTLKFMPAWSWRIAFLLGGIVGIVAIFFRKNLVDPPKFKPANRKEKSLRNLFKSYPQELLAGVAIGGFTVMPYTTVIIFINPVLTTSEYLSKLQLMSLQAFLILVSMATLLIVGKIADRFSPDKVMKYTCISMVIFAFPILFLVDLEHFSLIILAELLLVIINQSLLAPANAYLKNLFPTEYRYRATSISFCTGMSVIGGITPLAEDFLYKINKHFCIISIWLIFISLVTLLALFKTTARERSHYLEPAF